MEDRRKVKPKDKNSVALYPSRCEIQITIYELILSGMLITACNILRDAGLQLAGLFLAVFFF